MNNNGWSIQNFLEAGGFHPHSGLIYTQQHTFCMYKKNKPIHQQSLIQFALHQTRVRNLINNLCMFSSFWWSCFMSSMPPGSSKLLNSETRAEHLACESEISASREESVDSTLWVGVPVTTALDVKVRLLLLVLLCLLCFSGVKILSKLSVPASQSGTRVLI